MTNHSNYLRPEHVEGHPKPVEEPPSGGVPERRRGSNHQVQTCLPALDPGSQLNKQFPSPKFLFSEVTAYLQKFGRHTYGQHFTIIEEDYETIYKLFVYLYQDEQQAEKLNIKLHKGILLTGPVGCGKTTLMNLLKHIHPPHKQFVMVPTRKIAYEFSEYGIKTIHKYTTQSFRTQGANVLPKDYCFDDLGVETSLPHFGASLNVMAEILLGRYDLFVSHQMLTYITTNLSVIEIEEFYGNRVRSRMREMLNVLAFKADIGDKRR
ncbi:MAG: ATPase [Cyclobacteriaceae bacterium]|uniref:ATPase n=1 Tax=Fulvivirga sp. TaxID=1931237 RepID=UPI0032EC03D2